MDRVSSVTAFLYRYLRNADSEASEILSALSDTERRTVELLVSARAPEERLRRLNEATGTVWSAARYDRVLELALNQLQQILLQRGLLQ
jgi:hypothetical protein